MINFIEEHWVAILTLIVNCGMLKIIYNIVTEYIKKSEAKEIALRGLLRTEIISICSKSLERGFIQIWASDNLIELHDSYKALGGNGTTTELYKQAMALPRRNGHEG